MALMSADRLGSPDRLGGCGTPLVIQKSTNLTTLDIGWPVRSALAALRERRYGRGEAGRARTWITAASLESSPPAAPRSIRNGSTG